LGNGERNYTVFFDEKEITGLSNDNWTFDCDGVKPTTISTEVVMSTKKGDVKFTGVFTIEEYGKLCDMYEEMKIIGG
jgi:hypothetical protein